MPLRRSSRLSGIFIIAFVVILFTKIDEPEQADLKKIEEKEHAKKLAPGQKDKYSAFSFRHFKLGILAIFLYMGIEVGVPTYILQYLTAAQDAVTPGLGMDAYIVGLIVAVYWLMMLVGRFVGGAIGSKVSSKQMITVASTAAIVLILFGMFAPQTWLVNIPGVDWAKLEVIWAEVLKWVSSPSSSWVFAHRSCGEVSSTWLWRVWANTLLSLQAHS